MTGDIPGDRISGENWRRPNDRKYVGGVESQEIF